MVKNFGFQLLFHDMPWKLDSIWQHDLQLIEENGLATIFTVFRKLVQQLPDKTIIF